MKRKRKPLGHTSNGRGSLLIERRFPEPIGQLRMASGTKDRETLKDINAMLTAMERSVPPRWDILQAIKAKRVAPTHALGLWRMGRLQDVPSAELLPPLSAAYEAWAARLEVSTAYRDQIACTFRQLLTHGTEPRIGDLPTLLASRRDEAAERRTPIGFNRSKAHVQAFVRDTLTEDHPLYRQVTRVATLAAEDEAQRRAQLPSALPALLAPLDPEDRLVAWSLAVTGMRPKEYFDAEAWAVLSDRVQVRYGKTASARRDLPLWAPGLPALPTRTRDAFENKWERRIGKRLGIYDLRRSFKVWMEDSGITLSRIKIYMGHAAGDVTGLYSRRELDAWLQDDAGRLDSFAGSVVRAALSADAIVEVA